MPESASATPPVDQAGEKLDFEASLAEIETVVRKLESGELSLDDSLRQYESAVKKMRQCYELLEIAERRVSVLAGFDADGNPVTQPLDDAGGGHGNDTETLLEKQKTRGQRRGAVSSESTSENSSAGDDQ
ncbi:exodeoxyribonuclease VII small subunit [Allorhodopirellula solitaria]|uniref:Exodeoxyribonuclease 7 small subunit n=1 Tax=Allorhodopirellula solitaria TaxID=2527987 RepID=A0A5C5X8N8_9BACT|nr:exodeoxyribonuclease VII small subunit [Allorhodopirellula solitaria]TWT59234.1 Exodeoxyribonuclease 7 small subunit [Allorhodopirellula solitaria]